MLSAAFTLMQPFCYIFGITDKTVVSGECLPILPQIYLSGTAVSEGKILQGLEFYGNLSCTGTSGFSIWKIRFLTYLLVSLMFQSK